MKKYSFILLLVVGTLSVNAQKRVAILWDASYSMLDKDIEKELRLLDTLVQENAISTLKLTVFSDKILSDKIFNTLETISDIKSILTKINYDGSSNAPDLNQLKSYDLILCFSDLKNTELVANDKLYFVSSKLSNEMSSFQFNKINYINLNIEAINTAYAIIKKTKLLDEVDINTLSQNNGRIKISGKLFDEFGEMSGIKVKSLETGNSNQSSSLGFYEIESFDGDLLQFSKNEKVFKTIKIYSKSDKSIDLNLSEKTTALEEVVIEAKSKEELRVSGTTIEETRKLGYAIAQVNASDFTPADRTIGEMVGKNVAGIRGQANNKLGSVIIRGFSSLEGNNHPLVFIDDIAVESSTKSNKVDYGSFVDPNNIESVKVLKSLAATSIYGPQATNGVILIYTKNASYQTSSSKSRKNVYDKKLEVKTINESYLKIAETLSQADSMEAAYKLYLKERLKSDNEKNLIYYFNTSDYFDKNGEYNTALRILSNIEEIFPFNEKELLALAFKYEEKHYNREALKVYQKIEELYPNAIQNKRNLANSYYRNNAFGKSLSTYLDLLNSDREQRLPSEFKKLVLNEAKHVYAVHKDKIKGVEIPEFIKRSTTADGRLVFEWNDTSSNFDLQFINPDKLYYNWKHNSLDSKDRISEEQNYFYRSQEFMLLGAEKGDWYFNILKPEGLNSGDNTFIKMTMYKDYGRPNEIKTVKLVNLNFTDKSQTIAKVRIN